MYAMTAVEVFERCKNWEKDKQKMRDRIERYRESAMRITASIGGDGIRGTSEPDKLAAITAEVDDLERAIEQRDREYAAEIAAACKLLDMLPDVECAIINKYYIQGKPLTAVAREMSYSYGYVRTAKSAACAHLHDIPTPIVSALLPDWYRDIHRK